MLKRGFLIYPVIFHVVTVMIILVLRCTWSASSACLTNGTLVPTPWLVFVTWLLWRTLWLTGSCVHDWVPLVGRQHPQLLSSRRKTAVRPAVLLLFCHHCEVMLAWVKVSWNHTVKAASLLTSLSTISLHGKECHDHLKRSCSLPFIIHPDTVSAGVPSVSLVDGHFTEFALSPHSILSYLDVTSRKNIMMCEDLPGKGRCGADRLWSSVSFSFWGEIRHESEIMDNIWNYIIQTEWGSGALGHENCWLEVWLQLHQYQFLESSHLTVLTLNWFSSWRQLLHLLATFLDHLNISARILDCSSSLHMRRLYFPLQKHLCYFEIISDALSPLQVTFWWPLCCVGS